jgi:hypothetical protein
VTKGQANLLRVFAAWTIWVWGTRIWNIWGDEDTSAGFKAVHTVLAAVSVALAVAALVVVSRVRRRRLAGEARGADGSGGAPDAASEPTTSAR